MQNMPPRPPMPMPMQGVPTRKPAGAGAPPDMAQMMPPRKAAPSGAPVGAPDSPQASAALSAARQALASFMAEEKDPQDRAKAQQALDLIHQIGA